MILIDINKIIKIKFYILLLNISDFYKASSRVFPPWASDNSLAPP